MKPTMPKKTRWTTAFFHFVLFVGLGYLQAIIAMYPFKDQPSSNLSYAFYTDVGLAVLLTSVLYGLCSWPLLRIKRTGLQLILQGVLVGLLWFWIDWGIFQDREAGWSTYTTRESLYYTCYYSRLPLIVACVLFLLGSWRVKPRRIK